MCHNVRRILLKLAFAGGLGGARHDRVGTARHVLSSVHEHFAEELPLHRRLYAAFDQLCSSEQQNVVGQIENSLAIGVPLDADELSAVKAQSKGPFFAQEGEDCILSDLFPADHLGFYVDVGAHHPYRFSNTAYFSLRGWSGINIDAAPGAVAAFARARPNDVTVECAVGLTEDEMDFFLFDEPALNTLEPDRARQLEQETNYRVKEVRRLPVRRLDAILSEHLPRGKRIDFLSIDVEGHELAVVHSNDWQRYRPTYVLLELLGRGMLDLAEDPVVQEMRKVDYEPFVKGTRTVFFRDTKA